MNAFASSTVSQNATRYTLTPSTQLNRRMNPGASLRARTTGRFATQNRADTSSSTLEKMSIGIAPAASGPSRPSTFA